MSESDRQQELLQLNQKNKINESNIAKLKQYGDTQSTLNEMLSISLMQLSLKEQLEQILAIILDISWLSLEKKGCVFLTDENGTGLKIIAHHNLSDALLTTCKHIKFGQCLCGKAAAEQVLIFRDCVDDDHELRPADIKPHGHYNVPVVSNGKTLGVLNLYVKHGHEQSQIEQDFLEASAKTIASIIERKLVQIELNHLASHDTLTGLINRYEFEKRTNQLLLKTRNINQQHALCFLDLDQFKVINDTCGHYAGDELLRQLGKLLQNTVRNSDTLARLGGDEFGLLIENCSIDQAHRIANTILKSIMEYQFLWERETFRIGASIGLVAIDHTTGNFSELFKQADAACYIAKDQGRNRIHSYHMEDIEVASHHGEMQWVSRINQALDENRFCLYAQAIVSLKDDSHKHYELLIRMIENGETIPPGAFLPAAERFNIIEKLDAWVVNEACNYLFENPKIVEEINFLSINLSGPSLSNKSLLSSIEKNLIAKSIPPGKICFEITETAAIGNLSSATEFIKTLRQLGCKFALDDFGSGLSSFGYLKNLPVDYLKIDGMFVKDIVDDEIDRAMVKSINEIGHVMGMQTIAEFVENDEIKNMLKHMGVDYAQGYGLGKPGPMEEIIDIS